MKKIISIGGIILNLSLIGQASAQQFIPQEHFFIPPVAFNNYLAPPIAVKEEDFGFFSLSLAQKSAVTGEFFLGNVQALGSLAIGVLSLGLIGAHGIPSITNIDGWAYFLTGIALSVSLARLSVHSFSKAGKILKKAKINFERNKFFGAPSFIKSPSIKAGKGKIR